MILSYLNSRYSPWFNIGIAFLSLVAFANAQGLPAIISESYSRFSECTSFVNTCPPTRSSCASYLCQQCTGVGYKAINSCCLQPDPAACLQTYVATANGNSVAVSSPAQSSITPDAYGSACNSLSNIFATCESQTPGFSTLGDVDAASCLCYSGSSWIPNVFDNYAMSCGSFYAEYSDYSDASIYSAGDNLCSSVGNILMGAASVSASTTSAAFGAPATASSAQSASTAAMPSNSGSSATSTQPSAAAMPSNSGSSTTSAQPSAITTGNSATSNYKIPRRGILSLVLTLAISMTLQIL